MEKALRQKVIISALEHSVIILCENKQVQQKGRERYSYHPPLEIYALQG